jgi:hypothetical protein
MPRYVILEHDHPELHWDLMLEVDGALKTWRLPATPPDQPRTALAIGNHRVAYLDYEGPVSGNRGSVKQWDAGQYELLERAARKWTVQLHGARWQGVVVLRQQNESSYQISFTGDRSDS